MKNVADRVKQLREKLHSVTTANGKCGCRQPYLFVTIQPEKYTPTMCKRCRGWKIPVFVDEDDIRG